MSRTTCGKADAYSDPIDVLLIELQDAWAARISSRLVIWALDEAHLLFDVLRDKVMSADMLARGDAFDHKGLLLFRY